MLVNQGAERDTARAELAEHLEGLVAIQRGRPDGEHGDGPAPVLDELGDRQVGHGVRA
jgi:hypothetical protein